MYPRSEVYTVLRMIHQVQTVFCGIGCPGMVNWIRKERNENGSAFKNSHHRCGNRGDRILSKLEKVENNAFEEIFKMIQASKMKAAYQINTTVIDLYWNIGAYVSARTESDGWGKSTVQQLSAFILQREPGIRGYSAQNIWRMKQFYETYRDTPELSTLLRENSWSNNLHIMSKATSMQERTFYLELAKKEKYSARDLARQIDSGYYERLMISKSGALPAADEKNASDVIRDMYMLEFLSLPDPYKENDLQKAILRNMKKFLLEFGSDFILIGEEYHLQVGNKDFYVDLLFYHRELQCLVAVDLKIDDFKPEYLGKIDFYLEALDRDVRKPKENPSVGLILCKSADADVVEYAMSRNLSSTMIAEYRTKLIDKEILRAKLDELYEIEEDGEKSQQ